MIEVAYYILELFKFMIIYLLGFSMKMTKVTARRIVVCCLTVFMGIVMNFLKLSLVYPVLYILFVVIVFYLLIELVSYRSVVIVFWSIGVIFSVDSISYVLLRLGLRITEYQLNQYQNLFASCITLIILGIIFGVISHNQKKALQELSVWYFVAFLVICMVNAAVLAIIEKKLMNVHGEFTAVYIMLVISSLIQMAFVLVLASSNNWHRKNEKLKEQYLELQAEHYQYLEERNFATKKFRHDMRAHMYIIKQCIYEKQWDKLTNYVDTICGELEYMPGYLSVKNESVDAILNYYDNQFTKRNMSLKVSGNLPQECHVHAYDLCTIFSNILSNAIENIEELEERQVLLSLYFDNDIIFIREENTYTGKLEKNGKEIVTTKADKEQHGFGIQNIRDSVEKYKGSVTITETGQCFIMDIVMENMEPLERIQEKSGEMK